MHVPVSAQAHLGLPRPDHPATDQAAWPSGHDLLHETADLIDDNHDRSVRLRNRPDVTVR